MSIKFIGILLPCEGDVPPQVIAALGEVLRDILHVDLSKVDVVVLDGKEILQAASKAAAEKLVEIPIESVINMEEVGPITRVHNKVLQLISSAGFSVNNNSSNLQKKGFAVVIQSLFSTKAYESMRNEAFVVIEKSRRSARLRADLEMATSKPFIAALEEYFEYEES